LRDLRSLPPMLDAVPVPEADPARHARDEVDVG
jgi:hypothetical protein